MIRRALKSECKYLISDLKATSKVQLLLCLAYAIFYCYCAWNREVLGDLPFELVELVSKLATTYIFVRLLLSGIAIPNNVYSIEYEHRGLSKKASLYNGYCFTFITVRIIIKCIFSFILTMGSFFLIINALGLMYNIGNYLLVFFLSLLEVLHLLSLGFLICVLMQKYEIRREYIFIFELLFLFVFVWNNRYNHLLPTSIMLSLIESSFTNELLYSQFSFIDVIDEIPYLLCISLLSPLLITISNSLIRNVITKKQQ